MRVLALFLQQLERCVMRLLVAMLRVAVRAASSVAPVAGAACELLHKSNAIRIGINLRDL